MPTLIDVLTEVMKSYGYETQTDYEMEGVSGAVYTVPIYAVKGDMHLVLDCKESGDETTLADIGLFIDTLKDIGVDAGIFATVGRFGKEVAKAAATEGTTLWDRERLEREVGRTILAEVIGASSILQEPWDAVSREPDDGHGVGKITEDWGVSEDAGPLFFVPPNEIFAQAVSSGKERPWSKEEEQLRNDSSCGHGSDATGEPDTGFMFDMFGQTDGEPPVADTAVGPGHTESHDDGERILQPRFDGQMASRIAKNRIFTIDSEELILIPYEICDYRCELLVEGRLDTDYKVGRMAVHARLKNADEWKGDTAWVSRKEMPGVKMTFQEPRYDLSELDEAALDAVVERNSRDVEVEVDSDEVTIVERKKVRPKGDAIEIKSLGIHYLPIWRFKGRNGLVEIDATNGKVVNEELRNRVSDAVLI